MTKTELQFLEEIWRNGGKANIYLLARRLGVSPNYISTIPGCGLYKKYFVRRVNSKCYEITSEGIEALVKLGKIKKAKPKIVNVEFEDNNGNLPEKNMVGNKKIEKTASILEKINKINFFGGGEQKHAENSKTKVGGY